MVSGSADEHLLESFAGAQRAGIGQFTADPCSMQWMWSDAIYEMFGHQPEIGAPVWSFILEHIPGDERPVVEKAWEQARSRVGPFSWSHRVQAADGHVRSVLVVGETMTATQGDLRPLDAAVDGIEVPSTALTMRGYVIDLTELRREGARTAATEAVQAAGSHRAVIEQAKGALMLAYGLDAEAAFAFLAWHSQHSNRKLHVVAADLMARLRSDPVTSTGLRHSVDVIVRSS